MPTSTKTLQISNAGIDISSFTLSVQSGSGTITPNIISRASLISGTSIVYDNTVKVIQVTSNPIGAAPCSNNILISTNGCKSYLWRFNPPPGNLIIAIHRDYTNCDFVVTNFTLTIGEEITICSKLDIPVRPPDINGEEIIFLGPC